MSSMVVTEPARSIRISTDWGEMVLDIAGANVVGVRPPRKLATDARVLRRIPTLQQTEVAPQIRALGLRLERYFGGEDVQLASPEQVSAWLEAAGVDGFRRDASVVLTSVPRGVTVSYGQLAELAGRPGAARAAGATCARNPIPILVPCHRVLHSGARRGDVGRYGAADGPDYKRRLLELEGSSHLRS